MEFPERKRHLVTRDAWIFTSHSSRITAHWFDINGDLATGPKLQACIALRRIVGRCTNTVLASLIESVSAKYNISGKVSHCVIDSGSNFIKAFRDFGPQQ